MNEGLPFYDFFFFYFLIIYEANIGTEGMFIIPSAFLVHFII